MIVCAKCGMPLSDEVASDPPERCNSGWQSSRRCNGRKWIAQEDYQARIDAARKASQPEPVQLPEGFGANVIPDSMSEYFDWSLGARISSRSQREKLAAEKGCIVTSAAENYREHGVPHQAGKTAISFAGQKHHKSTAERAGVRATNGTPMV